jgi:Ca2+-transporting ATPase
MVFLVLISANIFLTLVNRSFYYSMFTSMKNKNNLIVFIIGITIALAGLLLYIKPLAHFFQFESLKLSQLIVSSGIGWLSVIWFEGYKWYKRTF